MSIFSIGAGGDTQFYSYNISKSLRFDDDSSSHLHRTPSGSSSNRRTWTFSAWVKRATFGTQQFIWSATSSSATRSMIYFETDGTLRVYFRESGVNMGQGSGTSVVQISDAKFHDTSAWYHVLVAVDTTQSTPANTVKLYVNGQLLTLSQSQYPTQNTDTLFNKVNVEHTLGVQGYDDASDFDGYMAEVHFVDGSQLTPTSFGETKSGVWIPIAYSGTHGTNGFYLNFADNSNIGNDASGSNNFTASSLNAHDVVPDSPTNNFATLNFNAKGAITLREGALFATSGNATRMATATMSLKGGKFYFEVYVNAQGNGTAIGIVPSEKGGGGIYSDANPNSIYYEYNGDKVEYNSTTSSAGAAYTAGDIIGVAVDGVSGSIQFFKNGASQFTHTRADIATKDYLPFVLNGSVTAGSQFTVNFGQDDTFINLTSTGSNTDASGFGTFKYSVPTNYYALCSRNLPTPTFPSDGNDLAEDYFTTTLYTGGGDVNASPVYAVASSSNFGGISGLTQKQTITTLTTTTTRRDGTTGDYIDGSGRALLFYAQHNGTTVYPATIGAKYSYEAGDHIRIATKNTSTSNSSVLSGTWTTGTINQTPIERYVFKTEFISHSETTWSVQSNSVHPEQRLEVETTGAGVFTITNQTNFNAQYTSGSIYIKPSSGTSPVTVIRNDGDGSSNYNDYFLFDNSAGFDITIDGVNVPNNSTNQGVPLIGSIYDLSYASSGAKTVDTVGFQPGWTWIKNRDQSDDHYMVDNLRGATREMVTSNSTVPAENVNSNGLTSFINNGFILGTSAAYNTTNEKYVSWNWKINDTPQSQTYTVEVISDSGNKYEFDDFGSGGVAITLQEGGTYTFDQSHSSNATHPLRFSTTSDGTHGGGSEYTTGVTTSGTPGQAGAYTRITVASPAPTLHYYCTNHSGMGGQVNTESTFGSSNFKGATQSVVTANDTSKISITKFTGTGSVTTVGHGLGVKPDMMLFVNLTGGSDWWYYHKSMGATAGLKLNEQESPGGSPDIRLNDTEPTADVFTVGTSSATNGSNDGMLAFCTAGLDGYTKFGEYEGNGRDDTDNPNGTFVYTGFRPAWVLIKARSGSNSSWILCDNKRLGYNSDNNSLSPNANSAESTTDRIEFLSNGFRAINTTGAVNNSNVFFVYWAIAETPFKFANAR